MTEKYQDLLSGWKEIADFLDKSVRTVQRWSRQSGLPVTWPAGRGSTPHASKQELQTWIFNPCGRLSSTGSEAHAQ